MRSLVLVLLSLSCFSVKGQTIDSVSYQYDVNNQELTGYVQGYFVNLNTLDAITAINDTVAGDTIIVTVDFLTDNTFPMFTYYDTVFTRSIVLSSGSKTIKTLAYWGTDSDTTSSYFNPIPGYVDTAYFELSVPVGLYELSIGFLINPNPVVNEVIINDKHGLENPRFHLYNELGNLIMILEEGVNDVSNLPMGSYQIIAKCDNMIISSRIVKL